MAANKDNSMDYDKENFDLLEKSTAQSMFMLLVRNIQMANPINLIFILSFSFVLTSKY